MKEHDCVIVWFRQDLRLADNPALAFAVKHAKQIIPLFILDEDDPRTPGGASRWWLHESLDALAQDLKAKGSSLILARGGALNVLEDLIGKSGATGVVWNRVYEPWARNRDSGIKTTLREQGVMAKSFNAGLLKEPHEIATRNGDPFRVFTPFWKTLAQEVDQAAEPLPPLPALPPTPKGLASEALSVWSLQPSRPDWAGGLRRAWAVGEKAANDRLDRFLDGAAATYKTDRDRPDLTGTSRLSPHLHFGEIGPRQVWARVQARIADGSLQSNQGWAFLRELGWREFSTHLLYHFPSLVDENFNPKFDAFPWQGDAMALSRWQQGRTGYPIIDAGMRELWETGWMHNRVRMIVASFLIKHLLVDWRQGEAWFWDTLVDADLANNAASWQWVAGSGADAAPYFRIFNPILQGEKFDTRGDYVRRWVPELSGLPDKFIHKPWEAPAKVLDDANVTLDETYPAPMVDHKAARNRALAAFDRIKSAKTA
jgi:deoxyribodipyrimidine photo-lyase